MVHVCIKCQQRRDLGIREMELNALTKHCSPRVKSRSRSIVVNGSGQDVSWRIFV